MIPKVYVALTFDDGTLYQYKLLTFLHRCNIPATIFCTTHVVRHPDTNKVLLSSFPEKVKELHDMGHEVGSHTCTHSNLTKLDARILEKELRESKIILENIIGDEVSGFAYPYSLYDHNVIEKVKKFYFYARSGPNFRDPLNCENKNKYKISSIGIKKAFTLPFRRSYWKSLDNAFAVFMLHDVPMYILYSLILYLKTLYEPLFLTMKEIAYLIEKRDS